MKKISEMTMNELSACLCKIAGPAEKLYSDDAVRDAFDEMRKSMGKKQTVQAAFSLFVTILVPVLTSDVHREDTCAIMAELGQVDAKSISEANGLEMMRDMFRVFVVDGDVEAIFRPCTEVRSK